MNPKDLDRCKSVLKLYLKISDTFYESQQNTGAKFTKGRLKFRKDVKESITTALQLIDKYEQYEGCIMKDIIDENQDLKDILLTRDHCIKTQGEEIGRLKGALAKEREAMGVFETLSISPPPMLEQKYHWIFYQGIENWKQEVFRRIKKILWRDVTPHNKEDK